MKLTEALALTTVLSIALAGCSHREIETTKAAIVPQDSTHTYETALSNRGSCEKEEWHASKDETNRMVVEYRCTLKNGPKLLAALREQKIREIQNDYQGYYRGLDQAVNDTKQSPEISNKLLSEAKETLAQAQADQARANASLGNDDPVHALRRAAVQSEMGSVASAKFSAERAQQHLNESTEDLEKKLASLEGERARFEKEEKEALVQIDKMYDGIVKASEVFRWFVKDNEVVPASAGVEFEKLNGSVTHVNKDWKLTMRDLLHYRGDDHVRYVLNVSGNIVPGQ
jgi:chromosome segregation ATPase